MDKPFLSDGTLVSRDPLLVLNELGGFYECPRDESGKRLGPLVGYAGRDEQGRQYVGDLYANFGEAEQWPWIFDAWTTRFRVQIEPLVIDTYVGMPMGSIILGSVFARTMRARGIFAEKRIAELASETGRERSRLIFYRHGIRRPGKERVAICEDVTNNLSTASEAIGLIDDQGGQVVAILSLLNRSGKTRFVSRSSDIPLIALTQRILPQYRQDDPMVMDDVQAGNVVWKAKSEWIRLATAMQAHKR